LLLRLNEKNVVEFSSKGVTMSKFAIFNNSREINSFQWLILNSVSYTIAENACAKIVPEIQSGFSYLNRVLID